MAYLFTTPEPSININLDQDLLADAEEGSISFWEKDLALWRDCVANLKEYDQKKWLRREAEDEEDSSFDLNYAYQILYTIDPIFAPLSSRSIPKNKLAIDPEESSAKLIRTAICSRASKPVKAAICLHNAVASVCLCRAKGGSFALGGAERSFNIA